MNLPVALSPASLAAWRQVYTLLHYCELMAHANGYANDELLATIISNQHFARSVLPADLGLGAARYQATTARHFPCMRLNLPEHWQHAEPLPEHQDLVDLLLRYRANKDESEWDIAHMLATACAGSDHLWRDLGLNHREQLSALFESNFPQLAALNKLDMKWKKFLYKQLCEEDGVYVCRAPSCDACKDHSQCFGPEK